jgi:hypothetical protein
MIMNSLEKYSLETVIETLKKCSGIQICVIYPNLWDAEGDYQRVMSLFGALKLISCQRSYNLELANGSGLWFFAESERGNQLRGRRAHQVFVKDVSEKFINENCRPLVSAKLDKGPLYRTGVFRLYDEEDETRRAAETIITEVRQCRTEKQLGLALSKALNQIGK